MIIEMWIVFVGLALVSSVVAFAVWDNPILFLVAGLLWLVAGWNAGNIEMEVVYDLTDYSREFRYPFIVLFFSLIGLAQIILSIFNFFNYFQEGFEEVAG